MSEKHGMRNTVFYQRWRGMINRCRHTKLYKDKNIVFCKRWKSFLNFKKDMYASYLEHKKNHKKTTLERINNNKNYYPDNCCWATPAEQNGNKSDTLIYKYLGEKKSLKQIARQVGINYITLHARLRRYGYSLDEALKLKNINERRKRPVNKISVDGKIVQTFGSLTEASKNIGVDKTSIWQACQKKGRTSASFYWEYV